jgi:1,4-dihydroxy-2-naphthoate octaprenyltransferase
MKIKGVITIMRVPFLILALILGGLGAAVAWYEAKRFGTPFQGGYALLATAGLLICHAAVNIFNEYFDCRSGLDYRTRRTPFSGGSGAVPSGLLTIRQALSLGIACLVLVLPIGVFFTMVKGWALVPLLILAVLLIVLYSPVILKMGYPEWSPGLGLGVLPVLGAYFVHTGAYSVSALVASLPSFFLVHNLLLLNEFPDAEADRTVGRRTLPIVLGKRRAAYVYCLFVILVYLWVAGAVIAGAMPAWTLLAFLTLPLAVQVIQGAFRYDDWGAIIPILGKNVQLTLSVQALIALGYLLAGLLAH